MYLLDKALHTLHIGRRPSGLQALEANYLISQFASGMVSVMGVVFVYQLGTSLAQGLWYVLLFYGLQRLAVILFLPIGGWLVEHVGYRKSMMVGMFALIGRLALLSQTSSDNLYLLAPALVLGGLYIPSYFVAFHGLFLEDGDEEHVGSQMGMMEALKRVTLVGSPFFAGFLASEFGFGVMFGVAVVLLLVSLVPMFMMSHHKHKKHDIHWNEIFSVVEHHPKFAGAMFFWHFAQATVVFFWPIYLYEVVGDLELLGSITSAAMIFSSFSIYFFGKVYDQRPLHRLFPVLSMIAGLIWSLRFLVTSVVGVAMADALGRLTTPMWWMKIRRFELSVGEHIDRVAFGMGHELVVSLGFIIGLASGYFLLANTLGYWPLLVGMIVFGVFSSAYILRDE